MSRLARRGVIVKGGGSLETVAKTETVLLDKTGTVTAGQPRVLDVETFDDADPDEVVRLAASLDQVSAHVFAPALVQAARGRSLALAFPGGVAETAGQHLGYTIRPQADAGWIGEAGPGPRNWIPAPAVPTTTSPTATPRS